MSRFQLLFSCSHIWWTVRRNIQKYLLVQPGEQHPQSTVIAFLWSPSRSGWLTGHLLSCFWKSHSRLLFPADFLCPPPPTQMALWGNSDCHSEQITSVLLSLDWHWTLLSALGILHTRCTQGSSSSIRGQLTSPWGQVPLWHSSPYPSLCIPAKTCGTSLLFDSLDGWLSACSKWEWEP